MKKSVAAVLVLAVLAGAAGWCAGHHVVRTDQGVLVLAKRFLACGDSFVDMRTWSSADFDGHPELKSALVAGGYGDLLADLKARERHAVLDDLKNRAADMARDMAGQVAQKAEEVAAQVSEKIEETLAGE